MLTLITNRSQVCFGLTTALISCEHGQGSTFSFIRATVEAKNPQIRLRFPQTGKPCLSVQGTSTLHRKIFLRRVKQPPNILQKSTKHLPFKPTQYFESCDATFRVALLKLHNMSPNAINFHSATCLPPKQRVSVGRITRVVAELPDQVYPRWLPKDSGVNACALSSV